MRSTLTLITAGLAVAMNLWLPGLILAQSYPPSVSQLVANAKKQIRTINVATFKSAFDEDNFGRSAEMLYIMAV